MRHLLYSFRRCPYAIRTRMVLKQAAIDYDIIDISLKNKPAEMLALSPKGTVPVLVLSDGTVLDESLDIIYWALHINDPDCWLGHNQSLIHDNDTWFKMALDRYKYPTRYPHEDCSQSRDIVLKFLNMLNQHLNVHRFLQAHTITLSDVAIFPFIRQAANTNREWFDTLPLKKLQHWLDDFISSDLFTSIIQV